MVLAFGVGFEICVFVLPGIVILGVGLASLWARKSDVPWLAPLGVIVLIISVVGFYGVVAEVELQGLFQRGMETALAVFMLALGWALMKGLRAAQP